MSRRIAYVGSSNLTLGGLRGNVEANVRVEAPLSTREAEEPLTMFTRLFESEFSTPLTAEFETRYNELQEQQRSALAHHLDGNAVGRFRVAKALLVGSHRAQTASRRQLLVVTPDNYALCMRHGTWGQPGDIFFFHVTGGRGMAALGMFTGPAFHDQAEVWKNMGKGSFPWRRKFVVIGELRLVSGSGLIHRAAGLLTMMLVQGMSRRLLNFAQQRRRDFILRDLPLVDHRRGVGT